MDWESASKIVRPIHAGISSMAGIVASILGMGICVWLMYVKPHAFVLAFGFIAALRFLGSVFVLLTGKLGKNGSDEEHVALIFPIPEIALHIFGIVAMAATWYLLYRAVPKEKRGKTIGAVIAGTVAGGVLYIMIVGPVVLP